MKKQCKHEYITQEKQISIDNDNFAYEGAKFVFLVCKLCKKYQVKDLIFIGERDDLL